MIELIAKIAVAMWMYHQIPDHSIGIVFIVGLWWLEGSRVERLSREADSRRPPEQP